MSSSIESKLKRLVAADSEFPLDAYLFINDAVAFTVRRAAAEDGGRGRHVTAFELLEGSADFAAERFGPMAWDVLRHWGLETPEAFGRIVFKMIDHGLLSKNSDDSIEAFRIPYPLEDKFRPPGPTKADASPPFADWIDD